MKEHATYSMFIVQVDWKVDFDLQWFHADSQYNSGFNNKYIVL